MSFTRLQRNLQAEQSREVRKVYRKRLPYSISDIGGKEQLNAWKTMREEAEKSYAAHRKERRLDAIAAFNSGNGNYHEKKIPSPDFESTDTYPRAAEGLLTRAMTYIKRFIVRLYESAGFST